VTMTHHHWQKKEERGELASETLGTGLQIKILC